jgi:SDR family mycofactocin-dependent oxidoreductase
MTGRADTGRLAGKVAFITGAARGQGRAHAVRLASEGADIIAVDIAAELPGVPYDSATPEDLAETERQVEALDRRIITARVDTRDFEAMREFVDRAAAELGRLDIVVGNAGICIPNAWDAISPQEFRDVIDTNVTGVWNTVMVGAPHLVRAGGGSVVLTSSYAGKKVQPFMVHYTTSKHAVTGMTRAFAAELGAHGIRVNSVHPGAVMTPMGSGDMQGALERAGATYPRLNGMGTPFLQDQFAAAPEEISSVVAFLASDEAKWITSEHISVDGGAQYF